MRISRRIPLSITVLIMLTLSCSLFVPSEDDNPAPGCRQGFGMGGCFGTTVILDLNVEPQIECLEIEVNNCNGGVLDVDNDCQEAYFLEGIEILPSEYAVLDVVEKGVDNYSFIQIYSNFSDFTPQEDRSITVSSYLGEQEITISFTKTAPLCDE
jgi:hypothetical protein